MSERKQNTFFGGAAILAAGIVLVKLISAVYKIPLVNILGSGYTDFTQSFSVFNILLMVSTAGIPVAISKMISEANERGSQRQVHKIFRLSFLLFFTFGAVCSIIMFFGAGTFAAMMGDPKAENCMKALAPSVMLVSGLACFRGYAQGHRNMTPSSVSQIIEALFKLIVGLSLAVWLVHLGMSDSTAAAGAIVGVTVSELVALAYMVWDFLRSRSDEPRLHSEYPDSAKQILSTCLSLAIPITLTSSSTSIITAMDNALVLGRLQSALSMNLDAARGLMLNYSGVQTVYQIPAALMVAITASVIPAVTICFTRKDKAGAGKVVSSAYKMAALIAFPSGIGMMVLGKPIVQLLFHSLDADIAGRILSILGIANIFVCIMLVCNAVLQSHGILNLPIITMLVGGVVMVLFDYFVVAIPAVNIYGSPIGTCLCYGITCVLDLIIVHRVVPGCPSYQVIFGKVLLASVIMGAGAWAAYGLIHRVLGNTIGILGAICIAGCLYLVLIVVLQVLNKDDLSLMPKGALIGRLLRIH